MDNGRHGQTHGRGAVLGAGVRRGQALPEDKFAQFSSWFDAYEEKHWDQQIERDQKSGALRELMEKARADFEVGKCNRL